jgi:Domain of unknown function (DUF4157)
MEKSLLTPGTKAGKKAMRFFNPAIQAKLTVNNPNDKYEQEADTMADKVMRMEQPFIQAKPLIVIPVQRKCAHCEEEEKKVQLKKDINAEESTADNNLENYVGSLSGGGQSLPNDIRNFYEPRFGYDFSSVKVHTDNVAAKSAQSINALAYTNGNNIVFNSGQYAPNTDNGKRLLGHELTHVVQQNKTTALQKKIIQKSDAPQNWCSAFMKLVRYEEKNGKAWVLYEYNSFTTGIFGEETLIPLNHNIPSIHGDVDVDWMFRLAFIQYPFILASVYSPSMAEGFGLIASYLGYMGAKAFWNSIRAPFPEWRWEYGSIFEEGNWNSAGAIVDWIHHQKSLREIFAPAVEKCEELGY